MRWYGPRLPRSSGSHSKNPVRIALGRGERRVVPYRDDVLENANGFGMRAGGATFAVSVGVTSPVLRLVRNGNIRQTAAQFAEENLRFRIEVARVSVPPDADGIEASCKRLSDLCGAVNTAIRTLDLEREAVGDICFATRVRIAEVARILFSRRTAPGLREARRALHASLAFLLQTLPPALEPAPDSRRSPAVRPLDELATVVSAALSADPLDTAWFIELGEVELILAASKHEFASLGDLTTKRLLKLQRDIARWDESGRAVSTAMSLAKSLQLVLDASAKSAELRS